MKFTPKKMVGWYQVKQLSTTALRAVLSSIFGTYADKRESLAALCEAEVYDKYKDNDEFWFDYIADTGDGFNSTFSMASLISKDVLQVEATLSSKEKLQLASEDGVLELNKGSFVVFGGDQVYPTPSREEYNDRFVGPVGEASLQSGELESELFAVPGNHDWYDGLTNFVNIFCHHKKIGNFQTVQNRSYFAIQLNKNTWLWAIDIQLQSDIDEPQVMYFDWVAEQKMKAGDKVILCTAEPSWVYHSLRKDDMTYLNLEDFEKRCIVKNDFHQVLTLAGDLHHYARYSQVRVGKPDRHKITSGGGGAFLHPTHNLPKRLTDMHDGDFEFKESFPKRKTSRNLTFLNLLFPYKNPGFGMFLSFIHLIFAYVLYNTSYLDKTEGTIFSDFENTSAFFDEIILCRLFKTFMFSPPAIFILLVFILGFYAFCDGKSSKFRFAGIAGLSHGVLHVFLMISSLSFFSYFTHAILGVPDGPKGLVITAQVFLVGGLISGILVGIYLLFSSLILKMHDNEAFSSLKIEGYKNFLRMHLKNGKLTIYPIGIKKAARWKRLDGKFRSKDALRPFLIDDPISIDLNSKE